MFFSKSGRFKNNVRRLKANDASLTGLSLLSNQLGDVGATALADGLKHNTGLTTLLLWKNQIGDAGATALADALKHNTGLTLLNLSNNQIGDAGATALADALKHNTGLTKLDLQYNQIRDAGVTALADALKHNTGLKELRLSNNQISDAGATAFADALKHNTGLTLLNLSNNQIRDAGATALADALKHDTGLKELRLSDGKINDAGATALADALKHNTGLTTLHLMNNKISDAGAKALADALIYNDTLTYLNLDGNQISKDLQQKIEAIIEANKKGERKRRELPSHKPSPTPQPSLDQPKDATTENNKIQAGHESKIADCQPILETETNNPLQEELMDQLDQENDATTENNIKTRAELESKIADCKSILDAEKKDPQNLELMEQGEKAEVTLKQLEELRKSGQFPSIDEMKQQIKEKESQIRMAKSRPERKEIATHIKKLEEDIAKEQEAQRELPSYEPSSSPPLSFVQPNDVTTDNPPNPPNLEVMDQLDQENDATTENNIKTRAELESKIADCKSILDAEKKDPRNRELMEQGEKAEAALKQLEELRKSGQFPSIDEMKQQIKEKESQIRMAKSRSERKEIADCIEILEEDIAKEQQAQRELLKPRVIQKNADILYNAWKTEDSLPETPKIEIEYLRTTTNGFHKEKHLGSGGFAEVFLGVDHCYAFEFAIKRFHKSILDGPHGKKVLEQSERELKVLSQLRHDNIVRVLGYSNDDMNNLCLIYEYAAGGSMAKLLQTKEGRQLLHWRKRLNSAISVLSALKYLFTNDCSHRDLKPDNICFTEDLDRVLLIDFGMSRLVDNAAFTHTCTGLVGWSDPYVAPEYKNGDLKDAEGRLHFDERCEIYSFGFVLQGLMTGVLPKPANDSCPADFLYANPDKDAGKWPAEVVQCMADLSVQCLDKNRTKRKTIDEALDILLALQYNFPAELNDSENAIIQASLLVSAPGKNISKPNGECRCGRHSDRGLICNRHLNPHFCCNHCFNEHVKKYLGEEEIKCCVKGCDAYAYTNHQLEEHAEKPVLAEHLRVQQEKRYMKDEAHRRRNAQISNVEQADFLNMVNKLSKGQEMLAAGELKCPMQYVLVRVRSTPRQVFGRQWKNPLKIYKRYLLYYLCAHDRTKIKYGIELKQTKKWVKKVAPALKISFLMVRIGLELIAGIDIQFLDWLAQLGLEGVQTEEILEKLQDGSEHLEEYLLGALDGDRTESERLNLLRDAQTVSHEAYEEMSKIAKENFSKWRPHMEMAQNKAGILAWVKKENAHKWRQSGVV